ncbi:TRAP transporter small permease [Haliea sp. E17]|uniref:TRAP transporter small permease n=1 Tax=Haliea sp. E17 TaxID=3401576 RepID=UPI003AABAD6D
MSFRRIITPVDAVLQRVLALLMLLLVACVTWQVVSRYLLGDPSSWTEELARYLLVWIGLLGAAYAYGCRAHMAIDLLEGRLGKSARAVQRAVIALLVLVFALLVSVLGGGSLVALTWELQQVSAAMGVPMALVYTVIPLSGLLVALYACAEINDALRSDVR